MAKTTRPTRAGFGLTAHVPSADYEHRTKPTRNRPRVKPLDTKSTKPRTHRVGRSKR